MTATLNAWATHMVSEGFSPQTVRSRLQIVRQVAAHEGTNPAELVTAHVRTFLAARPLTDWSRLAYLQHLRAWARFAQIPDPTEGIRRPHTPRLLPDPLSEDSLLRLLQHLSGSVERVWVLLGAYAGLRAHEVAKLHADDIRPEGLRVLGKGRRVDVIPLAPILTAALAPYVGTGRLCWGGITPGKVSRRIGCAAREVDIAMRFHQCRHRFGSQSYRRTRDLLLTQRLMRHSSPKTTAGYAALHDVDAQSTVNQLPGASPEEVTEE
jgi:integrase